MTDEELERLKLQVEAWKTTIETQQHFNDLEMRIRGLAITVVTAVLAAAGVVLKDGDQIHILGRNVSLATVLIVVGIIAWLMFYMVDQMWYHRLLYGAVKQGEVQENQLEAVLPGIGLTKAISAASPYPITRPTRKRNRIAGKRKQILFHSRHKLQFFYWGLAALLVVLAFASSSVKVVPAATTSTTTTTTTRRRGSPSPTSVVSPRPTTRSSPRTP